MISDTSTSSLHRSFERGSTASSVQPLHTRIPGRVRFKVANLYRSRAVQRRLESGLSDLDGIETIQTNVLTGNLLIVFDPKRSIEDIARHIADTLATKPPPASGSKPGVGLSRCQPTSQPPITARQPLHLITDALHFTAMPAVFLGSSPLVRLPIAFLRSFSLGLFHTSPILILLMSLIALMGLSIGKKEGWSRSDALYFSFVTASTIGYGDLHPTKKSTKLLSIAIGLVGILLTGVVTSIGVHSAQKTFQNIS